MQDMNCFDWRIESKKRKNWNENKKWHNYFANEKKKIFSVKI